MPIIEKVVKSSVVASGKVGSGRGHAGDAVSSLLVLLDFLFHACIPLHINLQTNQII